jgi:predicted nucleic acid-binding protein
VALQANYVRGFQKIGVIGGSMHIMTTEAGYAGAAEAVLENVRTGVFQIPFRLQDAAPELQRIFRKYRDCEVDLADACLIHLASALRTGGILTLDRNFEIYRWGRNHPFRLLPKVVWK